MLSIFPSSLNLFFFIFCYIYSCYIFISNVVCLVLLIACINYSTELLQSFILARLLKSFSKKIKEVLLKIFMGNGPIVIQNEI